MSEKSSTFAAFFDINYKIYRLMKKIFTFVSAAMLALGLQAAELDTVQVDGIFYQINKETSTAMLIRESASSKYEIEDIFIPVNVEKDEVSYPVVALGQGALRNTTAKTITFAEGSQVTELGTQAFQAAVNVKELELPEGIKVIPLTCIHNATATNPMTMKKLVFPASLDSIARLSICLPQLETLEFKGSVPPRINTFYVAASSYTQNPWEVNKDNVCNTNKEALVIVPDGALEAYKNTEWIGDYFTTIVEKKDAPTAIENTNANTFKSGVYTITGSYLGEDATNLPKGMYIINGKKVIR